VDSMDNLAHKMLHTFEKMDPINPTFDSKIAAQNERNET